MKQPIILLYFSIGLLWCSKVWLYNWLQRDQIWRSFKRSCQFYESLFRFWQFSNFLWQYLYPKFIVVHGQKIRITFNDLSRLIREAFSAIYVTLEWLERFGDANWGSFLALPLCQAKGIKISGDNKKFWLSFSLWWQSMTRCVTDCQTKKIVLNFDKSLLWVNDHYLLFK